MTAHPDSAGIIAALPLRPRPGLYIDQAPDETGHLLVLEEPADPIIGLAIRGEDGWYLGCIECCGEIEEADSGMCRPCRADLAYEDEMYVRNAPDEPRPEDY